MTKYYIDSYEKKEQSFLAKLNSIDYRTGQAWENYDITLTKKTFFGLFESKVTISTSLPAKFDHKNELVKGREWVSKGRGKIS